MNIYCDNNATTRLDERVLKAMLPYLRDTYANPSSLHQPGRAARAAIDTARDQVAQLVSAHPSQVLFTGGGTEANNMAIKGLAARLKSGRILVSAIEHPAVLEPGQMLTRSGWQVEQIPVDAQGRLDEQAYRWLLDKGEVRIVACMFANNETGVLQDIPEISALARQHGALMHCDAVQAAGKIPLSYRESGAHTMSLSAHKIHGPKGMGALILDKGLDIEALHHGGSHERGLRGGTENTAAIVGFGVAAALAVQELEQRSAHTQALRDHLEHGLTALSSVQVFAAGAQRLPNTLQFAVTGFDGESLLMALDRYGIAVSSGSACASGSVEPSHVLLAMGLSAEVAKGAIRVSFGKDNTLAEVDQLLSALAQIIQGGAPMPSINPAVMA